MKGLKIFHPNGDLLSKPEAYDFYNVRYNSPESEAGIVDILPTAKAVGFLGTNATQPAKPVLQVLPKSAMPRR